MEVKELLEKAQRNLQVLSQKLSEVEQQRQMILSEICRYQGEVRALTQLEAPQENKEGDRHTERVEKKEGRKPPK